MAEKDDKVNEFLAVGLVALLVGIGVYYYFYVDSQRRHKINYGTAITGNLRQIASAGQQYILVNGASEIGYKNLVGVYFSPIQPLSGESYKHLVIDEEGGVLRVWPSSGGEVVFTY